MSTGPMCSILVGRWYLMPSGELARCTKLWGTAALFEYEKTRGGVHLSAEAAKRILRHAASPEPRRTT